MLIYDIRKKEARLDSPRTPVAGWVVGDVTKSDTRGSPVELLRQLADERFRMPAANALASCSTFLCDIPFGCFYLRIPPYDGRNQRDRKFPGARDTHVILSSQRTAFFCILRCCGCHIA